LSTREPLDSGQVAAIIQQQFPDLAGINFETLFELLGGNETAYGASINNRTFCGDEVTEAIGVSGTLCVDPAATERTAEKADAVTRMRESSLGLHGYSAAERVQVRQVDGRSLVRRRLADSDRICSAVCSGAHSVPTA
jgi:hypothetical protein